MNDFHCQYIELQSTQINKLNLVNITIIWKCLLYWSYMNWDDYAKYSLNIGAVCKKYCRSVLHSYFLHWMARHKERKLRFNILSNKAILGFYFCIIHFYMNYITSFSEQIISFVLNYLFQCFLFLLSVTYLISFVCRRNVN